MLHNWCNKGRGICYPVCGMVHIKEPLLLIRKISPCGGSGFPLSLSEWSLTICLTPYNCKIKCVECFVNKTFPSFLPEFPNNFNLCFSSEWQQARPEDDRTGPQRHQGKEETENGTPQRFVQTARHRRRNRPIVMAVIRVRPFNWPIESNIIGRSVLMI